MFYSETVLDNGVTVLTESMDTLRSVALGIWFSVGSRDETPAEAGMSHFMEHMMFKGTPSRTPAQISEAFDELGAELNAFTSKEYTCYYSRLVDEHVPTALEVLSDMVTNASLEEDACEREREVVIEEIARMEDSPDDRVHEMFAGTLWPNHPIGLPILGSRETVGSFDNAASVEYRRQHYTTGNCCVAAAGNIEHEEHVALVEQYLALPEGPRAERTHADDTDTTRLAVFTKETEQSHICYGTSCMNAHHPDRFVLAIIDSVLGGGMSSRLFQEIREKRGLAYAVYSFHSLFQDTGQFAVYAGTRPDNTAEVIDLVREECERVAGSGLEDHEIERAQESIKGHLVLGLESTRNRMTRLGKNQVTGGEILSVDEVVERIEAVTADDVKRVAADVFAGETALAVIGPESEDQLAEQIA
jgi:predicted Zn-dependent peptidase